MELTLAEMRLTGRLIDYDRIIEEKDVQIEKLLDDLGEAEGNERLAQSNADGKQSVIDSTIEMIDLALENIEKDKRQSYTPEEVGELLEDLKRELQEG